MSIRLGSCPERQSLAFVWSGGGRGIWLGAAAGVAVALAGCAGVPHRAAQAPAAAEVLFSRTDPTTVSAMIADRCRAVGWAVDRVESASVTCTGRVTPGRRIMTALLMENAKRQTQSVSHHFMISSAGGDEVRVRAESWLSDPDRGRRRELGPAKAAKVDREMAGFLVLMGGRLARAGDGESIGQP
jgi:hypothetical protein